MKVQKQTTITIIIKGQGLEVTEKEAKELRDSLNEAFPKVQRDASKDMVDYIKKLKEFEKQKSDAPTVPWPIPLRWPTWHGGPICGGQMPIQTPES